MREGGGREEGGRRGGRREGGGSLVSGLTFVSCTCGGILSEHGANGWP